MHREPQSRYMHMCSTLLHLHILIFDSRVSPCGLQRKIKERQAVTTLWQPTPYCSLARTILNLSNLLVKKKFAGKGNKEGAVEAIKQLEEDGLGKIVKAKVQRGTACVSAQRCYSASQ